MNIGQTRVELEKSLDQVLEPTDYFSIICKTGVITLRAPLDREKEDLIEVVVTVQDAINIAPFRRKIRVVDKNDNAPKFVRGVYKFEVDETEPVGKTLFSEIAISDLDEG